MLKRSVAALTLACAVAATIVACRGDRVAAPATAPASAPTVAPAAKGDLLGSLTGTLTNTVTGTLTATVTTDTSITEALPVVNRLTPLANDVTWSFVAGPNGATSRNSATGLTVVVPQGALAANTTITVKALAGSVVAYEFQPHGITFAKPVTLRQDLSLTNVAAILGLTPMAGAYYNTSTLPLDPTTGLVTVNELEPTTVDLLHLAVSFKIGHFSGYVVACGRSGQ